MKSDLALRPPIIPPNAFNKHRVRLLKRVHAHSMPMSNDLVSIGSIEAKKQRTMRDRELEADGDEGFILNLREHWRIANPEQVNDIIPEIMDGHNLIDIFDPEIEERLNKLEEQEAAFEAAGFYEQSNWFKDEDANNPKMKKIRATATKIREVRALRILESRARKQVRRPQVHRSVRPASITKMRSDLSVRGLKVNMQKEGERGRSLKRAARARNSVPNRHREESIARASVSRSRSGVRDEKMDKCAKHLAKLAQRKVVHLSRKGEGDHHIPTLKPKHLFSGKRSSGTASHR